MRDDLALEEDHICMINGDDSCCGSAWKLRKGGGWQVDGQAWSEEEMR